MKTETVRRAIAEGNHELLSALGRIGGKKSAEKRRQNANAKKKDEEFQKILQEVIAKNVAEDIAKDRVKLALDQAMLYHVSREGDVLPADEIITF